MKVKIPKAVAIVELDGAPFRNTREAMVWAADHGIVGLMSDVGTRGKGEISISLNSIWKMASGSVVDIAILYGCVSFGEILYRAKTTMKIYHERGRRNKAYSYEISNIEILKGNAAPVARPNNRTPLSTGILLNGVCDVNGRPILAIKAQNPNEEGV